MVNPEYNPNGRTKYIIRNGYGIYNHDPIEVIPLAITHGVKRGLPSRPKKPARPETKLMTLAPMSIASIWVSGDQEQMTSQKEVLRDLGYDRATPTLTLDQLHDTGQHISGPSHGASSVYIKEDQYPRRHIAFTTEDPGAFWERASREERVSIRAMADLILVLANPTETTIQQIQANIETFQTS